MYPSDKDSEEEADTKEAEEAAEDTADKEPEEKPKKKVYYVTDMVMQGQYVNMFANRSLTRLFLHIISTSRLSSSLSIRMKTLLSRE